MVIMVMRKESASVTLYTAWWFYMHRFGVDIRKGAVGADFGWVKLVGCGYVYRIVW